MSDSDKKQEGYLSSFSNGAKLIKPTPKRAQVPILNNMMGSSNIHPNNTEMVPNMRMSYENSMPLGPLSESSTLNTILNFIGSVNIPPKNQGFSFDGLKIPILGNDLNLITSKFELIWRL